MSRIKFKAGDIVKYVGRPSRPDVTVGKNYGVQRTSDYGGGFVRVKDDAGDGHDIPMEDVELVSEAEFGEETVYGRGVERPKWLGVGNDGDSIPWTGDEFWSTLIVYDEENQAWVYRGGADGVLRLTGENDRKPPKDYPAERAAMLFLVFAEEEEAANES